MFKKNSFVLGIAIGVFVTVAGYFTLVFLNELISGWFGLKAVFSQSTVDVIAIFLNVFPFRYYMLKLEMDYTGRGILMVTFITGLTYFFYYLK
jgi:hypothetical protein